MGRRNVGGVLAGGPHRLEAQRKTEVPAVVAPGCLDMVNFGERSSVPPQFEGRNFYQHNPHVTLMRTTPEECSEIERPLQANSINLSDPSNSFFP